MFRNAKSSKVLLALLLPACLAAPGARSCSTNTTYSGQAFGASVNVLGLQLTVSDTGLLPPSGGALSTQLASVNLPGILNLGLLTESTTGGSYQTSSQSSVANANVDVAGIGVTASVLTANATARACGGGIPSVAGSSNIVNLRVNGLPIVVTGEPNQTIPLLVGSLVINEQIGSITDTSCGGRASMVVNALHLRVLGIADVVISSAQSGVSCVQSPTGSI